MENQKELETEIGTEESVNLKAELVKVEEVNIEELDVKGKPVKKVVCRCKHPGAIEPVNISAAKVERSGNLKVGGLWYKFDSENKIQKGSTLATFMTTVKATKLSELVGKEVQTILDDKGYLCFKGY